MMCLQQQQTPLESVCSKAKAFTLTTARYCLRPAVVGLHVRGWFGFFFVPALCLLSLLVHGSNTSSRQ